MNQGASSATSALRSVQNLANSDTVANFTPAQIESFRRATEIANGGGGYIPTAQQTFLDTANGVGLDSFVPASAMSTLNGNQNFLSPEMQAQLAQLSEGGVLPGTDALQNTANGDFLFGGDGFNAAVDAAVRAAQPHILSTFGSAGAGGASGGLAKTAIGKSAIDAFASQYANERANQLGAASSLANFGLGDRSSRLNAINTAGGIAQGENAQRLNAAGMLSGLADTERSRQLMAAGQLPDIGLLDSNLLQQVGDRQQGQEQREIEGPMNAQLQLLMAALNGLPISSLLGSTTTQTTEADPFAQILGGAMTGLSIFGSGGLFPLMGGEKLTGIDMASLPKRRGLLG
ncbi:hypothetical protein BA177_06180 [Woeseia oceani]|uniref:Uncharacterized protein n=2 Tax=Woeseia oceani TaxID=1548547 RepID=A0A193LEP1_9GAMM|nr:hypothetical protein BA177_06180 [Woeseia oceani]